VVRDLKELVRHGALRTSWAPPVLTTVAETGEGVDELVAAIDRHGDEISASGELERRRISRLRAEVEAIVVERAAERARHALHEGTMSRELDGDLSRVDPYALAERILNGHSREPSEQ
jgi:LAO/AO transport system kinase